MKKLLRCRSARARRVARSTISIDKSPRDSPRSRFRIRQFVLERSCAAGAAAPVASRPNPVFSELAAPAQNRFAADSDALSRATARPRLTAARFRGTLHRINRAVAAPPGGPPLRGRSVFGYIRATFRRPA
jgi:hypothetical protein